MILNTPPMKIHKIWMLAHKLVIQKMKKNAKGP
jgi:hypothetical protein